MMIDLIMVVLTGTVLLLMLGVFLTFMLLQHQERRFRHRAEVQAMHATYQEEVLKARLEMQEQTAGAISREIHDNVGQILSLARLHLSKRGQGALPQQNHVLGLELLDQAVADLRDLSRQLSTDFVRDRPLPELLQFQLDLIRKTGALETSFALKGMEWPLPPEPKLLLYRIAQELLHNSLKHAEASHLEVHLQYVPGALELRVQDNGKGFRVKEQSGQLMAAAGIGTRTMHHRAKMIGAKLCIRSEPGSGTTALLMYNFKELENAET